MFALLPTLASPRPVSQLTAVKNRKVWRLSVEHRNTVTPRVDDVLETLVHLCSTRFAVDTRHQQGVVVGVDMAHGCDDGEAYSVAVQGSPGGASSHTAAAACRRMKCDRLGAVDRTSRVGSSAACRGGLSSAGMASSSHLASYSRMNSSAASDFPLPKPCRSRKFARITRTLRATR